VLRRGSGAHNGKKMVPMIRAVVLLVACVVLMVPDVSARAFKPRDVPAKELRKGLFLPYPLRRVFRGFAECWDGQWRHRAIDIGGIGPEGGLGTAIRSMVKAKITRIGTPKTKPKWFGTYDRRRGRAKRHGHYYRRSARIAGYGRVHFFTRRQGKWRTGVIIETVGVGRELKGHKIRYMHLATAHPKLKVGDVVKAGQVIGLMGGTGVQESAPHVHVDAANLDGEKIDLEVLFGRRKSSKICERSDRSVGRITRVTWNLERCGKTAKTRNFRSGKYRLHEQRVAIPKGDRIVFRLDRVEGRWNPRLRLKDEKGRILYDGLQQARGSGTALVKKIRSGRHGRKASVSIKALRDVKVRLVVSRWPKKGTVKPPKDARYKLTADWKCKPRSP